MEVNKIIENLIYEREAESVSYSTKESIKEHKEQCDYLIDMLKAEENGLLLRLPCKVGTELFAVLDKCRAMVVSEEDCDDESSCLKCPYKKQFIVTQVSATKDVLMDEYFSRVPTYIWGKTLFATKEEADQALKQMGE